MLEFVGFQSIDARQNVGVPIDGIDAVAFSCSNEGEMNGNCLRSLVRAGEQAILSDKHPGFDRPFRLVIVYCNIRIFEKSCEREPVFQSIGDRLHQVVGRIEFVFCPHYDFSEALHEGLRFSAPDGQSEGRWFIFYVTFNFVQVSVYTESGIADIIFSEPCFEVFAPGVSAATSLDSLLVLKQCIETAGGVSLDYASEIFEEFEVSVEGQIRGVVEHGDFALGIADVGGNFAFANIVFVRSVLDLNGRVVGFDDGGLEQLFLLEVIQQREGGGSRLHPVTLSGARNDHISACKDLLLAIVGKSIIEFADDYLRQEAWTCIAARNRRAGFFCRDDVLFALGASTSFLAVFEDFQTGTHHLELMCEQVADEYRFDKAIRADRIFRFDRMWNRFVRQILGVIEDVLNAACFPIFGRRSRGIFNGVCIRRAGSRARVVFLRRFPIVAPVALFRLSDQCIELGLQIFEKVTQLVVAVQCLSKLFAEFCRAAFECGKRLAQLNILFPEVCIFAIT